MKVTCVSIARILRQYAWFGDFCGGKAHVDDLGTGFHSGGFTQVRAPCSRGNTLLLLDVSLLYEQCGYNVVSELSCGSRWFYWACLDSTLTSPYIGATKQRIQWHYAHVLITAQLSWPLPGPWWHHWWYCGVTEVYGTTGNATTGSVGWTSWCSLARWA